MILSGYFMSDSIFTAFDFQSPPQKRMKIDAHDRDEIEGDWVQFLKVYSQGFLRQGAPNDSGVLENGDA